MTSISHFYNLLVERRSGMRVIVLLMGLLILVGSCAAPIKTNIFYSIPTVTYLRECPDYDCAVVAEIYNADQVQVLAKNQAGWWKVQSDRDQKIGWTQRDLLSETPLSVKNYYIAVEGVPLRNSPSKDVVSRTLLARGDKFQKIAEREGWWRILVEKDKSLGWIPAASASEERPEEAGPEKDKRAEPGKTVPAPAPTPPLPQPNLYYVAAESLNLNLIPFSDSEVVKVLRINDKVEKISQSGTDWLKVRYLESGAEGWAPARFFKDSPVTAKTQIVPKKETPRKKSRAQKQPTPDPFKSETLEPEAM
jgi:uncharacterized protein YgiM (DUF1202 family)